MKKFLRTMLILVFVSASILPAMGNIGSRAADAGDMPRGISQTFYNCPHTTRGFTWLTENQVTDGAVYYVRAEEGQTASDVDWSGADVRRVQAASRTTQHTWLAGAAVATPTTYWTYRVAITGLEEGARYFYRVGSTSRDAFSQTGEITTTPRETRDFSFLVMNDVQGVNIGGFQDYRAMLEIAMQIEPDARFMVMPGDLVDDSHGGRHDIREWEMFFDVPGDIKRNLPVAPVAGNHESRDRAFADRFMIDFAGYDSNPDSVIGGTRSRGGFYAFTYGDVHFSMINTNDIEALFNGGQGAWLRQELAANQHQRFRVAAFHYSLHQTRSVDHAAQAARWRALISPIMARYNVDLVFMGHEHSIVRTQVFAAGENYDGVTLRQNIYQMTEIFEGRERTFYVEPGGTTYTKLSAINRFRTDPSRTPVHDRYIHPPALNRVPGSPVYGQRMGVNLTSPTFAVVSVRGERLVYETYITHNTNRTLANTQLLDYVAIRQGMAREFEQAMSVLPSVFEVSLRHMPQLAAARDAYKKLELGSIARINPELLSAYRFLAGAFDIDALLPTALSIIAVEDAIDAIGEVDLSLEARQRIETAAAAYDDLSNILQTQVANASVLFEAQTRLTNLTNAQNVEDMIAALDSASAGFGDVLRAARAAFDALTPAQRSMVGNSLRLAQLEQLYQQNQQNNNNNNNQEDPQHRYNGCSNANIAAGMFALLLAGVAVVVVSKKR